MMIIFLSICGVLMLLNITFRHLEKRKWIRGHRCGGKWISVGVYPTSNERWCVCSKCRHQHLFNWDTTIK